MPGSLAPPHEDRELAVRLGLHAREIGVAGCAWMRESSVSVGLPRENVGICCSQDSPTGIRLAKVGAGGAERDNYDGVCTLRWKPSKALKGKTSERRE